MHNIVKNLGLSLMALGIGVLLMEGLSRLAYPIQYGHKFFDDAGTAISPFDGPYGMTPSTRFWQKTQEFHKETTHTARGFRGPAKSFMDVGRPDTLFIGDSMTYGIGLGDTETIAYQYCQMQDLACINLGRPGTSTVWQVETLEQFLEKENIRPRTVYLIMNVMSTAQFGGNDLTDNAVDVQNRKTVATENQTPSSTQTQTMDVRSLAYAVRRDVLAQSNLARLVFYVFAPTIRNIMAPGLTEDAKQDAFDATRLQLDRLDKLSKQYNFSYRIILVHPMQDLTRATYTQTVTDMQSLLPPGAQLIGTAEALMQDGTPQKYYYPLDGHVTPEAAQKIAAYIAQHE